MPLSCIVQLLGEAEPPGVLAMPPVDDITKRVHAFLRVVVEPDPAPRLAIDPGYLFTGAQVFDRFRSLGPSNSVRDAAAIAAAIEPEYQAGFLRSSAMYIRINAKRAMGAHQASIAPLKKVEAGPPHERPISKDPEVLVALIGSCVHRGRGMDHGVGGRLAFA